MIVAEVTKEFQEDACPTTPTPIVALTPSPYHDPRVDHKVAKEMHIQEMFIRSESLEAQNSDLRGSISRIEGELKVSKVFVEDLLHTERERVA